MPYIKFRPKAPSENANVTSNYWHYVVTSKGMQYLHFDPRNVLDRCWWFASAKRVPVGDLPLLSEIHAIPHDHFSPPSSPGPKMHHKPPSSQTHQPPNHQIPPPPKSPSHNPPLHANPPDHRPDPYLTPEEYANLLLLKQAT